ncbi:MAG: alpha/beta hydrolase [Anaerolineae bacterium]|nr:alpha/beta hydrolase [Anaerolineae bacterium]
MPLRRMAFFALILFVLAFGSAAHAQNAVGVFAAAKCHPLLDAPPETRCGTLTVPLYHANPNGETISLAVAILPALNGQPRPDPVIYLEGGPGGSALTGLYGWLGVELREERDLILFDQRGTGFSKPGLFCDDFDYDFDVDEAESAEYYAVCAEELRDDGIDLSAFNSAESAADTAMLAQALGYEQVNLYGISYGTRVAMAVMRDHPAVVRSVVLDSPYPPQVMGYDEQAVNGWVAIKSLFAACEVDPACGDAFPGLLDAFTDYLFELDEDPQVYDFGDGEYEYYSSDIIDVLFAAMYGHNAIPYLPLAISDLIEGDPDTLAWAYSGAWEDYEDWEDEDWDEEDDELWALDDADAVYNSVECVEEIPFNRLSAAEALSQNIPDPFFDGLLYYVIDQFEICEVWEVSPAAEIETQPVISDIPTLVLAGEFDPITPPVWGETTVSTLSRGQLVVIPGAGHSLIDAGPCPSGLGVTFLNDPTAPLDASCTAGMVLVFEVE